MVFAVEADTEITAIADSVEISTFSDRIYPKIGIYLFYDHVTLMGRRSALRPGTKKAPSVDIIPS
jgi:hypothetical protein